MVLVGEALDVERMWVGKDEPLCEPWEASSGSWRSVREASNCVAINFLDRVV